MKLYLTYFSSIFIHLFTDLLYLTSSKELYDKYLASDRRKALQYITLLIMTASEVSRPASKYRLETINLLTYVNKRMYNFSSL